MKNAIRRTLSVFLILLTLVMSIPAFAVGGSSTLAKKGDKYVVNCSNLYVHSGAGSAYARIDMIKRGTVVTYYAMKSGWWYVRLPSGKFGFVDKQYLAPKGQEKTGYYAVTSAGLYLRENPRTSGTKCGTLKKGTKVLVTKLNGDWAYVSVGAKSGWVALKYLSKSGGTDVMDGKTCKTTAALNVRASASTSARKLDTIPKGKTVKIVKVNANRTWAYIRYTASNGKVKTGFVSTNYLR